MGLTGKYIIASFAVPRSISTVKNHNMSITLRAASLGISRLLLVAFCFISFTAAATNYTFSNSIGNWTDPTKWISGYPGTTVTGPQPGNTANTQQALLTVTSSK